MANGRANLVRFLLLFGPIILAVGLLLASFGFNRAHGEPGGRCQGVVLRADSVKAFDCSSS